MKTTLSFKSKKKLSLSLRSDIKFVTSGKLRNWSRLHFLAIPLCGSALGDTMEVR